MSDLPPSDAPADADAPVDSPSVDAPASDTPPAGDSGGSSSEDVFDREYVERLRQEAAEHRVKAREFGEVAERYKFFDDVPDEAREILLDLNRALVEDPTGSGAREMARLLRQLSGDDFDSLIEEVKTPQYLTREEARKEAEKVAEERERARIAAEAEQSLWKRVSDLGYERNSADAGLLLWYANVKHDGDLDAAHKSVQEHNQAVIDAYVASQREKNGKFPPVSGAIVDGPKPDAEDGPKSVSEASDRFRAWLDSQKQ